MSGKRATDHLEPSAKKRGNERQLTKDDASDDEDQVGRHPFSPACGQEAFSPAYREMDDG